MYCGSCGEQLLDNALFCPACGTPVKKRSGRCQVCGHENRPGAVFCGSCGAALAAGQSPDGESREVLAPDRPKLTWKSLCKLILVNWKNSLLRGIPLMLAVFCLSMVVHTFLLVYYNEGFGQSTWLGKQALATEGHAVSATVLWTMVSGFIFATIPAMRKKGFAGIADLFRLPGKTVKYLRECGPDGFQMFLTGIGLTLVISSIMSGMTSLTLAIGMAAIFAMPLGRILAILVQSFWMTLLQALRPEQAKNVSRFGVIPAYLLIIGTAAGFALGTVLPMTMIFGLAALAAVVIMIFTRKVPPGAVTQVLLFFSVIGYAVLYAKGVLAHDGGWLEGGGTWQTWIRSQGALQAMLQGLGPSIGAALGPALVAAASGVGPDDFRDDDGLPVEVVTTPIATFEMGDRGDESRDPEEPVEVITTPVTDFDLGEGTGDDSEPDSGEQVAYDQDGYDSEGYDRNGFNREGYDREGYNSTGYDRDGYDRDGYDINGFDRNGYDYDGFNAEGYDREGYDANGFNREGYDHMGYDRDGYNREGYDVDGFDRDGFGRDGFNRNGFDRQGFDRNGYDMEGYNRQGFHMDGYDMWGYDKDGFNKDGWDREGYSRTGYNRWGFDRNGRHIHGFTKDEIRDQMQQRRDDWKQNSQNWQNMRDRAGWFEGFYGWVKWGADQGVDFLSYLTGPAGQKIKHTYHFTKHLGGGVGEAWADDWKDTGSHLARGAGKGAVDAGLRYAWDNKAVKGLTKATGGKIPGLKDYAIKRPLDPNTTITKTLEGLAGRNVRSSTSDIIRNRFWDASKNLVQKDIRNAVTKDPVKNWVNKEIGN